jgi:hypothetical protein
MTCHSRVDMDAMKQHSPAQYIITQEQEQDAGCSLSVCRPAGLRYRPILVGAFCRRSTGFVGSALSRLRSRSRYARLGRCTGSKGKVKEAIAAAKTSAGQSSSRMRCTAVRACICHSVGAVCFLWVAVLFVLVASMLWHCWEYMD